MSGGAAPGGAAAEGHIAAPTFARAMEGFAPFEHQPLIAVAVSGGPDSLALLLLLDVWARSRGGSVLALTVDHGLRPDSTTEAIQVGDWAAARGIAHERLSWAGDKPSTGLQAAARAARYELLTKACATRGILHLAFAHHADDQAETILFRRQRGSGPAGLSGMPSARSLGPVRLIRPLLDWPKAALVNTCRRFGQPYCEDPSNSAERYARTALRRRLAGDRDERAALLSQARTAAAQRAQSEQSLARILSRLVEIRPDGFASIDRGGLAEIASNQRCGLLAAALRTVGGQAFAPGARAVARLEAALLSDRFNGASLAGCAIRPRRDRILLCREAERMPPPVTLSVGNWRCWDGRFRAKIADGAAELPVALGALGRAAFAAIRRDRDDGAPAIVGAGLPALSSDERLLAVPALGWGEKDDGRIELRYLPLWPLSSETFTVVYAEPDIMSL